VPVPPRPQPHLGAYCRSGIKPVRLGSAFKAVFEAGCGRCGALLPATRLFTPPPPSSCSRPWRPRPDPLAMPRPYPILPATAVIPWSELLLRFSTALHAELCICCAGSRAHRFTTSTRVCQPAYALASRLSVVCFSVGPRPQRKRYRRRCCSSAIAQRHRNRLRGNRNI
jgi:hypothetical protein